MSTLVRRPMLPCACRRHASITDCARCYRWLHSNSHAQASASDAAPAAADKKGSGGRRQRGGLRAGLGDKRSVRDVPRDAAAADGEAATARAAAAAAAPAATAEERAADVTEVVEKLKPLLDAWRAGRGGAGAAAAAAAAALPTPQA